MKKAMKYIIASAVVIIGIGMIAAGVMMGGMEKFKSKGLNTQEINQVLETGTVQNINLDLSVGDFKIAKGDSFRIEGNVIEEAFEYKNEGNELNIKYQPKAKHWYNHIQFNSYNSSKMTIYVPDNVYSKVKINMGVGSLNVENIKAEDAELELGVGESTFNNVSFNHLDMSTGVGEVNFSGVLTGESEVDSGVGSVTMNLITEGTRFNFKTDNGVGKVNIEDNYQGSTNKTEKFKVSNGIGDVIIKLK